MHSKWKASALLDTHLQTSLHRSAVGLEAVLPLQRLASVAATAILPLLFCPAAGGLPAAAPTAALAIPAPSTGGRLGTVGATAGSDALARTAAPSPSCCLLQKAAFDAVGEVLAEQRGAVLLPTSLIKDNAGKRASS